MLWLVTTSSPIHTDYDDGGHEDHVPFRLITLLKKVCVPHTIARKRTCEDIKMMISGSTTAIHDVLHKYPDSNTQPLCSASKCGQSKTEAFQLPLQQRQHPPAHAKPSRHCNLRLKILQPRTLQRRYIDRNAFVNQITYLRSRVAHNPAQNLLVDL